MGEVAAKIKIMPESIETDLNALKEELKEILPENAKLHGFREEPIAFGLKALIAVVLVDDAEGGTEKVEQSFSKINGVSSVQVVEVGRVL
ncbi:MAG: elongation factor 1-beta [Methanosarcinales archaeon]